MPWEFIKKLLTPLEADLCGGAEMGPFCSMVNLLFVFLRSFLSLSDNLRQWRLFRDEFAEKIMLRNILGSAMNNTEKKVLNEIPIFDWQYNDGDGGWQVDDSLQVRGRQPIERFSNDLLSSYQREPQTTQTTFY